MNESTPFRYPPNWLAITCDGNSITAGATATQMTNTGWPGWLSGSKFVRDNGILVQNYGIGGQGEEGGSPGEALSNSMTGNHADVDGGFRPERLKNILLAFEITNTIGQGATPAQAVQGLADYVAAVRSVHPAWIVGMFTAIPRYEVDPPYFNTQLDATNILLRSSYRQFSDFLVDLRCPGSPFNLPDYTINSFANSGLYTAQTGTIDGNTNATIYTHCTDYGYSCIAALVEQALIAYTRR